MEVFESIPSWVQLPNYLLLFFFGASLASFYITLGDRILLYFYGSKRKLSSGFERWKIVLSKPSECESCGTRINKWNLLPVFGYFLSRKKCNACGVTLPILFPLSEIFLGLLAVILFFITENLLGSISFLFLVGHLLISMKTDSEKMILDYENLPFILGFGILTNYLLFGELPGMEELYVYLGFLSFYGLIYLSFRGGTGLADVFFSPAFAFLVGHPYWMVYINSSYVLALLVTFLSKKPGESLRGKKIPMGLYFSLGLILSLLYKIILTNFSFGNSGIHD
ncbi:MAG: prepilin peptidase [Leptospira sp.]|nr:prepilin peptidase [Leptospira sp.]